MANLERETEEALGLPPRTSPASKAIKKYNELEASEKTEQPLNYNKPIVSYKKTNNPSAFGEQKESLNVGPFTYNSGRNSLKGNAFVEKKSTPNTTYPDGAVVNTQGKTVGIAVNGRLLLNKEGDNSLTAGFNKVKNTSNTNVQLPDGETQQFSDGSTAKGYNLGATLGRFIFDARKDTSTKGKDRYSGKVTYLLGDNADISIQDSTGGDTTVGFGFRKSFNHGGLASEHQDSDPEEMGYVEQAIKLFGSTIGLPNALDIFKGEPDETEEQIKLPKDVEEKVEDSLIQPLTDFGTSENFVDILDNYGMKKDVSPPLKTELNKKGRPVPVSSLRPQLRPDTISNPTMDFEGKSILDYRGAIEYIINMGYLLQDPNTGKILSGLDAKNEDHQAAILGFFKQASPSFNPRKSDGTIHSWCAVFVHHVLTNLGVDTLGPDQGPYGPRRSANAYRNYGTKVDGLENAQEGDIIVWDFNPDDGKSIGSHVAFYAGDRITKQGGDLVNVVGGNQGGQVSLRDQESLYNKKNIVAIRRITRNDITLNLTKDLFKQNPSFGQFLGKSSIAPKPDAQLNEGGLMRSHPSAMTADEYYDAESKRLEEEKQTEGALGLSSVPFFERPLDADVTDKQIGGFGEGETPIFRTILGNTYRVSRNPDQRTSRTKFKEDVVPAIKKFADDPRLPTKDEVVGAGTAVAKGAYDTFSTPKKLFTGEQSATETQMGDAFDIAGGTALGASAMKAPKGALRSFAGRDSDPGGPTYKDRTGPYIDKQVTAYVNPKASQSMKKMGELYNDVKEQLDPFNDEKSATPEALQIFSETPLKNVISLFEQVYNKDGTRKVSVLEEKQIIGDYLILSRQFASKYPNLFDQTTNKANDKEAGILKDSSQLIEFYIGSLNQTRGDGEQAFFDNPFIGSKYADRPEKDLFKFDIENVETEFPIPKEDALTGQLGLSQAQAVGFRKPIIEVVNTVKMTPRKIQGETFDTMLGRDFLTVLQKSPSIGKDSYSQILIDPSKRYTRDDLRKIVASDEYNVNGIDFGAKHKGDQRHYTVGYAGGKEVGYFEMPILFNVSPDRIKRVLSDPNNPKSKQIDTPKDPDNRIPNVVRMGEVHFDNRDLAHFRGSIIDPEGQLKAGPNMDPKDLIRFNGIVDGKKYLLIEEIQSDLLQGSFAKNRQEIPEKNFKKFMKESRESPDPSKDPAQIRYNTAKDFGFDFEEMFDKAFNAGLTYLDPSAPIANAERRAVRDEIYEAYKTAREKYKDSFLSDVVSRAISTGQNQVNNFPTLKELDYDYGFYGALSKELPDDKNYRIVKPPIAGTKNLKQVTDEVLKAAFSKAIQSGASRIVIPSANRMAVIRAHDVENPPKAFTQLYDTDLKKSLAELENNYPSVRISYDVVLPYRNDSDLVQFDPTSGDTSDFKYGDPKGIVIDISDLMQEKELLKPRQFAQGGLASMNEQTQRAFALGGQAETVDPVSGNEVPPGSLPEEVRDDIDAKLSEGEYVVPADVVRFFGVKYFEDLRTEAKMGLQQMDADGRIGGEPVPAEQPQVQDDSMEIAQLKAELSQSGMYAGGLTDGNTLDNFIDDASRSPMVNGRMRAGGATVKMAVGGLAVGNYGDVTKVDGIIKKLMTAANNDPALMSKLSSKGIMVNKTGADQKSAEMQQANKPQEPTEPVKMQEGGLPSNDDLMATATKTNPFLQKFSTIGGTAFEPMLDDFEDMSEEDKAALDAFTDPTGVIKEVFLVDAQGNKFTVAWNTAMPVPEGFTLEEIPEGFNATEAIYPAGTPTVPDTPRITGDDGPSTPYVSTSGRTGSGISSGGMGDKLSGGLLMGVNTDYEDMTLKQLQDAENELDNRASNSNTIGLVTSMLMKSNPVTAVISLITTGTKIAAERKKKDIAKAAVKKYGELKVEEEKNFPELSTKRLSDDYKKLDNNLRAYKKIYNEALGLGQVKTSVLNRAINTFTGREGDSLFSGKGKEGVPDIDDIWRDFLSEPQAPTDPAAAVANAPVPPSQENVPFLAAQSRDKGSERLFEKVRRDTAMGEAKRFESDKAQREADAARVAANSRESTTSYNPNTGNTSTYVMNPDGTRGYTGGTSADGRSFSTGQAAADAQAARQEEREKGYEQQRESFFGFNDGGLVAKLPVKKKKTTQRRKGLGTRP